MKSYELLLQYLDHVSEQMDLELIHDSDDEYENYDKDALDGGMEEDGIKESEENLERDNIMDVIFKIQDLSL